MRGSRAASGRRRSGRLDARALAQPDRRGDGGHEQRTRERVQGGVEARAGCERRQREGRGGGAHRHRGLPEPERKAALVAREPVKDRAAAGGDPGRAERPGERHAAEQRAVPVRRGDAGHHERGRAEAEGDHRPLPDPVGKDAPGEQRRDRAEAERAEDGRDLDEREPESALDRGAERRQTTLHRGQRRRSPRPDRKYHPAVAGGLRLGVCHREAVTDSSLRGRMRALSRVSHTVLTRPAHRRAVGRAGEDHMRTVS